MKNLRYGVIGCGVIAPTHVNAFQALPGVEVAWACDLVESKARTLAERFGIARTTTDYKTLLADETVDIVSVCTDHASHAAISVDALNAGKHVLCEKALAATTEGLQAMLEAGRKHPELAFGGVFQHRFDAAPQLLKELLAKGELGDILTAGCRVRCKRTRDYYTADKWRGTWAQEGGSLLINQAIHFIDQMVWIMGRIESLAGWYQNRTHTDSIETEDTAVAAVRFKNGALGTIEATSSSHLNWETKVSIHGTLGSVEFTGGRPSKVQFEDPEKHADYTTLFAACQDGKGAGGAKAYYGTGHAAQVAEFVEAVREGRPPCVTAEDARHTVEVVLAVYKACRTQGWVSPGQ